MRFDLLLLTTCLSVVNAHVALFDKGMFGKNFPGQDGDATVYWNNEEPVKPLREADALAVGQWFAHGHKGYPPKAGDYMVLPAGGTYNGDVACNRALTRLRNPTITTSLPQYACPADNGGIGVGALHTVNQYGKTPLSKWFGGSALAIAYTSDVSKLQPNDMTVISVNYDSVWERSINYQIPAGLPPCPSGGCLCTWNWIHTAGNGEGYPFEIYNNLYRCTVTGSTNKTNVVQRGTVPVDCSADASECVKGPKTPMYLYQADGNNLPHLDSPPLYRASWGFDNGAQKDIFIKASTPAPTTYIGNAYATPTTTGTARGQATATSIPAGWAAIGCNVDDVNSRALDGGSISGDNMTISYCTSSCASRGFKYAGLEYGVECWCGNTLKTKSAPASECNVNCAGDQWAKCGGPSRLNVYVNAQPPAADTTTAPSAFPTTALPTGWTAVGCAVDDPNTRALNRGSTSSVNMTVPKCISICASKGYPYAGVEYGQECWCGDTAKITLGSGCNMPCGGDPSTLCGGSYRLSLFKDSTVQSVAAVSKSIVVASAATARSTVAASSLQKPALIASSSKAATTSSTARPASISSSRTSAATSQVKSSSTSAVLHSPSSSVSKSTASTKTPVVTAAPTIAAPLSGTSDPAYVGCYTRPASVPVYSIMDNSTSQTPETCRRWCLDKKYTYAGIFQGKRCACLNNTAGLISSTSCQVKCPGDMTRMCGGSAAWSVYAVIAPQAKGRRGYPPPHGSFGGLRR